MLDGFIGGRRRAGHCPGLCDVRGRALSARPRRRPAFGSRKPGVPQVLHRRAVQRRCLPGPSWPCRNGLYKFVENGVINPVVGVFGRAVNGGGTLLRYVQTGAVETYLILMVIGIVLILGLNFGSF
ncbi:MAG: hypothetical protein WKG07_24910 [Hymenobacter sp.]